MYGPGGRREVFVSAAPASIGSVNKSGTTASLTSSTFVSVADEERLGFGCLSAGNSILCSKGAWGAGQSDERATSQEAADCSVRCDSWIDVSCSEARSM